MKSTEFITEATNPYKQAARLIEKNCGPFLRQIKNLKTDILYRGINDLAPNKLMTKGVCPVGRKPLDTPIDLHLAADEWFLKNTGIRYRSNAVFCTGDQFVAHGYGNLYAIFPIGEFSFCYSPLIGDLAGPLGDMSPSLEPAQRKAALAKILKGGKYKQNVDLRKAISSGHEIMIHCKQYYVVSTHGIDEVSADPSVEYLKVVEHINRGMLG